MGGRWCCLYRANDRNGDPLDTMLAERRDKVAAKAFFRSARAATAPTASFLRSHLWIREAASRARLCHQISTAIGGKRSCQSVASW